MYWGKLSFGSEEVTKIDAIKSVISANQENGLITHIYITDYKHFWVGKCENVYQQIADHEKTLAFYDNKDVSMWFKISDFDLLSNDFSETLTYLRALYVNNEYSQNSYDYISPYIRGADFPLIVQDRSQENFFHTGRILKDNELIVSGQHKGTFVVKPNTFNCLTTEIQQKLLRTESNLGKVSFEKTNKADILFTSYQEIIESVVGRSLSGVLDREFRDCFFFDLKLSRITDQKSKDCVPLKDALDKVKLSHLVSLYTDIDSFGNISKEHIRLKYPELLDFFLEDLIPIHQKINELRLKDQLSLKDALEIRNIILGIGCPGLLNKLTDLLILKSLFGIVA